MNRFHSIAVFLISLSLTGCGAHRAKSLRMLDDRAGYNKEEASVSIDSKKKIRRMTRTQAKVELYRLHKQELSEGRVFIGGWMQSEVVKPKWADEVPYGRKN